MKMTDNEIKNDTCETDDARIRNCWSEVEEALSSVGIVVEPSGENSTGVKMIDKDGQSVTLPLNYNIFPTREGWVCPVCGRGVAPDMTYCPCQCEEKGWEVT